MARGPAMRWTIFDLNASLYWVTLGAFPVPCYAVPVVGFRPFDPGDNYPDAGGYIHASFPV